jgi:hypothetical protein
MPQRFRLEIVVDAKTGKAVVEVNKLDKAVDGLGTETKKASGPITGLSNDIQSLISGQVVPAIGILVGFGAAVNKAFEFGEAGAQLQRLQQSGAQLAEGLGGNFDEILMKVRAASRGMVADSDIILATNRAMMLGLGADADQLGSLMEVAAFRARAMGISTTQAFNDIVTGVGRMSPMILDNLGIIVDAKSNYDAYAKSIGKSAAELTKAEKQQALFNAVLKDGQAQLEAAGGLVDDNASQYERLGASWTNFTDDLKEGVATALTPAVQALDLLLFGNKRIQEAIELHKLEVSEMADTYEDYADELVRVAEVTEGLGAADRFAIDSAGNLIREYDTLDGVMTEVLEEGFALSRMQLAVSRGMVEGSGNLRDYAAAMGLVVKSNAEATLSSESFVASIGSVDEALRIVKESVAGPVRRENERYAEEQAKIQEEIAETTAQLEELRSRQGMTVGTQEELTIAQQEAAVATTRLSEAQQTLAENTDPERQLELEAAVARASLGLAGANEELEKAGPRAADYSQSIGELEGNLAGLEGELVSLEETHSAAMNKIIFDMTMARLAADGWTEAEVDLALATAESMGLIDSETREAAQGMNAALTGFAEGAGVQETVDAIDDIARRVRGIPTKVNIEVAATYRTRLAQAVAEGAPLSTALGTIPGRQAGGPVSAGMPFIVGERAPELFIPNQAGRVEPMTMAETVTNNYNLTINTNAPMEPIVDDFHMMQAGVR